MMEYTADWFPMAIGKLQGYAYNYNILVQTFEETEADMQDQGHA